MRKPLHQLHESEIEATAEGMRWLDLVREHTLDIRGVDIEFNPASVVANTTVEQTLSVTGLKPQDIILSVIKPTLTAGFGVLQGRVSATDTLAVQLINTTAGAIDAPSEIYQIIYIKNTRP